MQLCRGPTAFNHLKPLNQSNSLHLATSDLSTLGGTSPQVARGCDCHWHSRAPHWLKCTACWPIKAMKLLHITGMCSDAWYIFYTYLCTYSRSNMEWGLNIHACTTCVMRIYLYGMVYHYYMYNYMYKYDRVYNKIGWIVLHDENWWNTYYTIVNNRNHILSGGSSALIVALFRPNDVDQRVSNFNGDSWQSTRKQ